MSRSTLSDVEGALRTHGAVFGSGGGMSSVPLHYGRPQEEYEALAHGVALVVRSWASRLVVTGADRVRFLNAMMTCDVCSLADGESTYGFLTTAQGRILSDAVVESGVERFDLELPWDRAAAVAEHLGRYVVADRVEIAPSDAVRVDLVGAAATAFVSALPSGPQGVEVAGASLALVESGRFGAPGFSAWIGDEELAAMLGPAAEEEVPTLPRLVGYEAWETVRVEAGVPRFGQDFDAENLPQETGLDEAVSYTKGCYLGQEIVARIHYRGQVPRGPRSLRLEGESCPPLDTPIRFEGHEVGRLTSAVQSPATGSVLGLALLHRRAWEAGTRVEVIGAGVAEVLQGEFPPPVTG